MKIAVHLVLWLSLFLEMFSLIEFCGWSSFSFTASSSTLYKIIHPWHCSYSADCPSSVCVMLRGEERRRMEKRLCKMDEDASSSLFFSPSLNWIVVPLFASISLSLFIHILLSPSFYSDLISSSFRQISLLSSWCHCQSTSLLSVCCDRIKGFLLSFFSSFCFSLDHEWQKGTWKNSLRLPKFLLSVKGVASIPYFLYTLILTFCCLMSLYHHLCSLYF